MSEEKRIVDWPAIRIGYESGTSLSALERQHGITRQAIKKRANRDQWVAGSVPFVVPPVTHGVLTRDVNAAVRVADALKLRAKKLTYQEIADQCGYSDAHSCRNAVQRELQRIVTEGVEDLRREESIILDSLHAAVWAHAIDERDVDQYSAVDRVLKISQARRELLGLNKPIDEAAKPQIIIREVPPGWLKLSPAQVVEAPQA